MVHAMTALDDATALTRESELDFSVEVSDAWSIGPIPNGGYLMALGAKALGALLDHPDPLTVTARYARPATPGPAEVRCEIIKRGRTQSAAVAKIVQGGKERLRVTGTFGDLGAASGPTLEPSAPPTLADVASITPRVGAPMKSSFADRVEIRFQPGTTDFLDGKTGPMELGGYIRLTGGPEPDPLVLLLLADAFPPPVLRGIEARVWVPTIELTVHVRRRPSPGWVRGWFTTSHLVDGALEEDGRLWDADGRLVAISRQYAQLAG